MPSFYFRHCIIKICRPEQPLLWLKICTWVQISGCELHRLLTALHVTQCPMAIAACVLMITYTCIQCAHSNFQAKERLLKF